MASVVSTVAGGLETPDFLELRKGRSVSDAIAASETGPRSLYQVVPEKQTSVRGLMGSERGYDVSGVTGAALPVLGDERGTKVCFSPALLSFSFFMLLFSARQTGLTSRLMLRSLKDCQRRSYVGGTMRIRGGTLVYLGRDGVRTFRIWWQRRWRTGRSRGWRGMVGTEKRRRSISFKARFPFLGRHNLYPGATNLAYVVLLNCSGSSPKMTEKWHDAFGTVSTLPSPAKQPTRSQSGAYLHNL